MHKQASNIQITIANRGGQREGVSRVGKAQKARDTKSKLIVPCFKKRECEMFASHH